MSYLQTWSIKKNMQKLLTIDEKSYSDKRYKQDNNMTKLWNYIKITSLHPVTPILFFSIIGGVILIVLKNDQNAFNYFLSCIGIGVSVAVVQCALIQNKIQKDNIKIQLFDKRYSIFQCVLNSETIIKRNNWDRYILFNENDIIKQMFQIEEELYKSTQLSMCLFDQHIYSKLIDVNNAYCKVAKLYKDMLIKNQNTFTSQKEIEEYNTIVNFYILSPDGFRTKEYEEKLRSRFPHLFINLMEFSKGCEAYLSFIEECGIKQDFKAYIVVDKLDR